jgi:hypothetical protein
MAQRNERNSGSGERKLGVGSLAVGTSSAARLGAGAKRLIHDFLDGAGAPAALRAAAETAIDLSRRPRRQLCDTYGATHVMVAQDIARTNDHGSRKLADTGWLSGYSMRVRSAKEKTVFSSNSKLGFGQSTAGTSGGKPEPI